MPSSEKQSEAGAYNEPGPPFCSLYCFHSSASNLLRELPAQHTFFLSLTFFVSLCLYLFFLSFSHSLPLFFYLFLSLCVFHSAVCCLSCLPSLSSHGMRTTVTSSLLCPKVITVGRRCEIQLLDSTGKLFASAPIREDTNKAVESVIDSSRYAARDRETSGSSHYLFSWLSSTVLMHKRNPIPSRP